MELAIPLIALGGLYIISNQPSSQNKNVNSKNVNSKNINYKNVNSQKENFSTMGKNPNYLPNVDIPPQNYPVTNINQLEDTVYEYSNPNTATDKYFDQTYFENRVEDGKKVGQNPQSIYSLTGNYLDSNQFKHNNMVPFEGGKIKGYTYDMNISESILDNMIGTGSQVIKKIEQAPLFKPEDNVQWAFGSPNNSDFYQSRVNPGMWNNNVKPFNTENVGPGLDKGYTTQGSGGYNSGMEARNAWLPKTVDELRVETNPKLEYKLLNHEGPANSIIKNVGIIGRVEKQHPDTFFINTQDRWLTTTGAEKGETLRPIQEMGIIRSPEPINKYIGPAGTLEGQASYAPKNFEETKRNVLPGKDVPISSAVGRGPIDDGDNNKKSHKNYANNRSTLKQADTIRSGFRVAIGAVIAPLLDVLKPSKKDEVTHNVRIYGDIKSHVPLNYVNNPNDTTNTTIKETTIYSPQFNINNQKESIYVNNYSPMDLTQRDTTSCSTLGNVGGISNQEGDMLYDAAYRQTNNEIKSSSIYNRPNQGGTQIFNQETNVQINKMAPEHNSNIFMTPNSVIKVPPSKYTYGKVNVPQYYNECIGCDRIDGNLLQAFRENPYTHSLTSSV
jgi:hypothetical protein